MRTAEIAGQRFGRLTVLSRSNIKLRDGRATWECRCDCGNTKIAVGKDLRRGDVQSCGCLKPDIDRTRFKTHGQRRTAAYTSWAMAKTRCTNPNFPGYKDYGGRGIRMCERWLNSFEAFVEDMGPRPAGHSIDRIDVNGHYEPGNCRWADDGTQANNHRTNVMLEFDGKRLSVSQWEREKGFAAGTVKRRIQRGWSAERALLTPVEQDRPGQGKC